MQCVEGFESDSVYAQSTLSSANSNQTIQEVLIPVENCVWKRSEPRVVEYVIYVFVISVLSCFGLCTNFINAIVFMRPKMTPSAFTYLATLAWLDCFSCLLILLTSLSRSVFYKRLAWTKFDFQWETPLFGISTGASNLMLASVSCDRWIYLRHGIANGIGPPRFCRRKMAHRVIAVLILISVVLNIPYFFVFSVSDDGTFQTHYLYYTTFYKIHNWVSFILLTLLPVIFLVVGNVAIILAFRRWTKQSKKFQQNGNRSAEITQKRYQHQMKLTITIIILIVLYLVGELPAALTSRKCALNLLFGGDESRMDFALLTHLDMIFLTLNALQLSLNIIIYAAINPSFMPEFFACLRGASDFCYNIFCLKPLIRCMRRYCCKPKIAKQQQTANNGVLCGCEHKLDANNVCENEAQRIEAGNSVGRSNEVSNESATANWDTEPEEAVGGLGFDLFFHWRNSATVQGTPKRGRFNSDQDRPESNQVWSTNTSWNRSSSFGDFAFDNTTLQVGSGSKENQHSCLEKTEVTEGNRIFKKERERHSLAF